MRIVEAESLCDNQLRDIKGLIKELASDIVATEEMVLATVANPYSHLFVVMDDDEKVMGCATLCVYDSPTGKKASVEDVVVSYAFRGKHLGRQLMEYLLKYAKENFGDVELHLTSNPKRVVANAMYQSLGFMKKETNAYVMRVKKGD